MRRHAAHADAPPRRLSQEEPAYAFPAASTRLFLFDRAEFLARLGPIPLDRPRPRNFMLALLEGHPPYALPEATITRMMQQRDLWRVDMLGRPPGMWSLHPALRSDEFLEALPELVRRVEEGDVPDGQRGDYDVNDSMVDWTSARLAKREQTWWRRLARRRRLRSGA